MIRVWSHHSHFMEIRTLYKEAAAATFSDGLGNKPLRVWKKIKKNGGGKLGKIKGVHAIRNES